MAFAAAAPGVVIALRGLTDPTEIDLEISVVELVASLLAALGPAAIAVYLLWRDSRLEAAGSAAAARLHRRLRGARRGVCMIALVGVGIVLNLVILMTGGDLEETVEDDEDAIELTVGTAAAGLAITLVAGVGEEIVYRAYAISRMEEAGYGRASVWAPWALFTVQHLYQGPLALLVIGAIGAVFVWLYRWKRSIWPVMVAHAFYDGLILAVAFSAS